MLDGVLNYTSEIDSLGRILNESKSQGIHLDKDLSAKLQSCIRTQQDPGLTVQNTQQLLNKLELGLSRVTTEDSPYTLQAYQYFIKDLKFALGQNRAYGFQRYFASEPGIDFPTAEGAEIIESRVDRRRPDAPLVVVVVDYHTDEHQEPVQKLVTDELFPKGFTTLFSESDVYTPDQELEPRASIASTPWSSPSSAAALEFFLGDLLKTYGAENAELYHDFATTAATGSQDEFVQGVIERSYAIIDNVQEQMAADGTNKSILISGAAHVDSLIERMEQNGMNYIVVNPEGGLSRRNLDDVRELYKKPT